MALTKKQGVALVTGLLYILLSGPMWFWILYQILLRVNASELMWFIYWAYVPVSLVVGILGMIVTHIFGDDRV